MVNILIRTSGRPIYFKRCIASIHSQSYKDVRIIIANDSNDFYCKEFDPIKMVREPMVEKYIDTARHFPFNDYLNHLLAHVKEGWVLLLDDDDELKHSYSLEHIMRKLNSTNQVAFWRVDVAGILIPHTSNWMKRPVKKDISGIGFCFHSKYIPLIHIAGWKQADYRLADQLYSWCKPVWINEILTATQNKLSAGNGERKDQQ